MLSSFIRNRSVMIITHALSLTLLVNPLLLLDPHLHSESELLLSLLSLLSAYLRFLLTLTLTLFNNPIPQTWIEIQVQSVSKIRYPISWIQQLNLVVQWLDEHACLGRGLWVAGGLHKWVAQVGCSGFQSSITLQNSDIISISISYTYAVESNLRATRSIT
jgi:hypothetical protein